MDDAVCMVKAQKLMKNALDEMVDDEPWATRTLCREVEVSELQESCDFCHEFSQTGL